MSTILALGFLIVSESNMDMGAMLILVFVNADVVKLNFKGVGWRFRHALLGGPKEKVVGILMIQTNNPNRELDRDFENAVMQAIVG